MSPREKALSQHALHFLNTTKQAPKALTRTFPPKGCRDLSDPAGTGLPLSPACFAGPLCRKLFLLLLEEAKNLT